MRPLILVLAFLTAVPATQAQTLHAAVVEAKTYIVGAANAPSGLHRFERDTTWTSVGWGGIRNFGLAFDPAADRTVYLASGNGVLRSPDGGLRWRVTTGWEITEVLDVAVDPGATDHLYIATAHGPWRSLDQGATWTSIKAGIAALPFTQAVAVDRTRPGHLVLGAESGLYHSADRGATWRPVGPRDVPIRSVRQSPHDASLWLAATQARGVLRSTDGGATWQPAGGALGRVTIYDVAFDPTTPGRVAAAGFHTGLFVSADGGRRWRVTRGLTEASIHAVAFDPAQPGRVWAGTIGRGVFSTDNAGRSWTPRGLYGATVYELAFTSAAP
jgi:photosystem II stability/assembly factor-like uncharacterized protein